MDYPCEKWQEYVAQKWNGLNPEGKEHFTSLLEIDDVFKYTLTLITQDDVDFVQSISSDHSVRKDTAEAARCRERGNSCFKSKDYTAAALHYSQGVCFAPINSEQLSLCYANRSAALYHLQHYQDSLDDIDKALKNGYPHHLLHKLEERRTQCLKHLSLGQNAEEDHHILASKNHKVHDRGEALTFGICPGATVSFSPEKGQHVVAVERIASGEVILTDRPYSCVLIPGMKAVKGKAEIQNSDRGVFFGMEHRRCHRCLTETMCPLPCDGCSYVRYCSASCQQDAWEEHHHWECPLGADLMVMGVMSQLALRVVLKAGWKNIHKARDLIQVKHTKSNSSDYSSCQTSYHGDSYLSVFHLLHHLNLHSPSQRFLGAVTVATLYLKLTLAGPLPTSWDISRPSWGQSGGQTPGEEGDVTNGSGELWLLGSTALRHFLQLRCNAQAIVLLQDTGSAKSPVQAVQESCIATAVFPILSLLNHSCSPNTTMMFHTGTIADPSGLDAHFCDRVSEERSAAPGVAATVRAAKVINPGQEILHCYGPHSCRMQTEERQRLLQEQYYFLCQCDACSLQTRQQEVRDTQWSGLYESGFLCGKCKGSLKKNSEDRGVGFICVQSSCDYSMSSYEVSRRLQEIKVNLEKAMDLMERDRPDEALRLLRQINCHSGLILAETHPLQGELEDAMARAYATLGDWKNASSHLKKSTVATASKYGEDSIELGQQLFKLAQLHFNSGTRRATLSVIAKVRHLLCLHFGPQCQELQELQAMEDCLRG